MIPARYAPVLFSFILSGTMSAIATALSTYAAAGAAPGFAALWLQGWASAWLFTFPLVLVVSPAARRIVERLTRAG